MENNFYPEQNGNKGQFPEQNQYAQPQYNQQYGNQFPGQNQYAQPQYNNQYTQNQYGNQQYSQGYNQPYNQQYQGYGYNQGGYTVAPQKKELGPVVMAIPAAIAPVIINIIVALIATNVATGVSNFLYFISNVATVAITAVCGFMAYKKPKGAISFLGCYFVTNCVAAVPAEIFKLLIGTGTAAGIFNIIALIIGAGLFVGAVYLYEKLKSDPEEAPSPLVFSANGISDMLKSQKGLFNPVFITAGTLATAFAINLLQAISSYALYNSSYRNYIRSNAGWSLFNDIIAIAAMIGLGWFLSRSFKKTFDYIGYVCIAVKVTVILKLIFSAPYSNLILNLFLALVFSAIGAAAVFGVAYFVEGAKKQKQIF